MAFIVSAVALALAVGLALIWPMLRAQREQRYSLLDLNVQVFEERLAELSQDYQSQKIDQDTFEALKTELERQLLSLADTETRTEQGSGLGRGAVLAIFLMVPLLAGIAYTSVAYQPHLWRWWQAQQDVGPIVDQLLAGQEPNQELLAKQNLADFARVMQQRLQQNPTHVDGWFMLAMAYVQGELPDQALIALENAHRLAPARDDIALAYAQTLVFSQRGQLSPLSRGLLMQVLANSPEHEGALLLMGMGALRSGDYAGALVFLPKLRAVHLARTGASPDSQAMIEIDKAIALAQQGGEPKTKATTGIEVTISLSKELQAKVQPTDTLFVFARALNGPPMPLAVVKQAVSNFPITVYLNDQQAMMPSLMLSKFPSVVVNARISKQGTPQGQSGDLEAIAVPVTQTAKLAHVELTINQVKP